MMAQKWYQEQAERFGLRAKIRISDHKPWTDIMLRDDARLAAHFARLALGCEWTHVTGTHALFQPQCQEQDDWVFRDDGDYCPYCGAPIKETR